MEKYDHSINKPLVLFRCGHTLCSKCVNNLVEKKCPSCSGIIEETRPNWALLKAAAESEYDKMKSEVLKKFTEIESLERKLETTEQQKTENNSDLIKRLKSHVESRASELIKQINTDKKMLLKEIEAKCKDLNQHEQQATTEPALLQTKEKKIESKAKLNDNKFDKQELMDLKSELISCLSLLNIKAKSIGEYADSFQLAVNENTKRGENLIGEIKKYQMSLLNVETGQASSEASHSNNLKTFEDEFNVRKENPMPNQIQCLQDLDENNLIIFADDPIIKQFLNRLQSSVKLKNPQLNSNAKVNFDLTNYSSSALYDDQILKEFTNHLRSLLKLKQSQLNSNAKKKSTSI